MSVLKASKAGMTGRFATSTFRSRPYEKGQYLGVGEHPIEEYSQGWRPHLGGHR